MKRFLTCTIILAMMASCLGCAAFAEEKPIVAVSLQTMENVLGAAIADSFNAAFGDEYDVQIAGADNDPNLQINQLQNFVSMGAKFILIMPIESASLYDVLQEAVDNNVLVYSAGTPFDEGYVTCQEIIDQYTTGEYCALMVKNWVESEFPDAEDGSIELAILGNTTTLDYIPRLAGYRMIAEPYLKNSDGEYIDLEQNVVDEAGRIANPIYCPAVKIVVETEAPYFQDGLTAMQNILLSNPEIKVIMGADTDCAMGASQAIMDDYNSNGTVKDLSKIGCFGVSVFDAESAAICDSSLGNGVVKGGVAFGAGDLVAGIVGVSETIINGQKGVDYPPIIWDPLTMVTAVNGERVDTPCAQGHGALIDCK